MCTAHMNLQLFNNNNFSFYLLKYSMKVPLLLELATFQAMFLC